MYFKGTLSYYSYRFDCFLWSYYVFYPFCVCMRTCRKQTKRKNEKKKTVLDIIKVSHFTLLFLVHAQYCGCDFRIICMGMVKKDSISHVSDCCSGKCVCVCMACKRVYNNQKQTRSRLLRSRNVYNTIQVHLWVSYTQRQDKFFLLCFFFGVPSQMYTTSNNISTHNNHQVWVQKPVHTVSGAPDRQKGWLEAWMTSVSRATILVEGVCECDLDKFRDIGPLVCVIIDEKKTFVEQTHVSLIMKDRTRWLRDFCVNSIKNISMLSTSNNVKASRKI